MFATNKPLSANKIAEITGKKIIEVKNTISDIQKDYTMNNRPFFIQEVSGGFSIAAKPEYSSWIKKLYGNDKKTNLSKASIETLAIIAYNQPITRSEIERIRGVDCSSVLLKLFKNDLIAIQGRKKIPGNPFLYRVTKNFLLYFGLKSIADLPPLNELGINNGKNETS